MTRDNLGTLWRERAETFRATRAQVDAAALCDRFLADLLTLDADGAHDVLTLTQAAAWSGFSAAHLRRLARSGDVASDGAGRARRFQRGHLPRKASGLASARSDTQLHGATAEQAVRRSVGLHIGASR